MTLAHDDIILDVTKSFQDAPFFNNWKERPICPKNMF